MTPEQAIQVLDRATSLLNVSRATHGEIIEAIRVLRDFIAPKAEK